MSIKTHLIIITNYFFQSRIVGHKVGIESFVPDFENENGDT